MSLFSYIQRLRQMPLKDRRQVANTWTVIIVGIIFLGWLALTVGHVGSVVSPDTDAPAPQSGIMPPY